MDRSVGIDFGTTNSAVGVAEADGRVTLARFPHRGGVSDTFRSILYFHPQLRDAQNRLAPLAGMRAIDRYLEAADEGRLMQSLKSYLADRTFERTNVFGRSLSLIDLLGLLLRDLRERAEEALGPLGRRLVVGRPVHFSNASGPEDDAFAVDRLRAAVLAAGFDEIVFEHEPVAAAYYYETRLDHDEVCLIADFGGGTSDFSVIMVGPSHRREGGGRILANDGVAIAGDVLDSRVLYQIVAPALGLGSTYRSMFGQALTVPVWIYDRLRRWHHLSFLKTPKNVELLKEIADQATEPEKIRALWHIVDDDLGYHLYRAVERAKVELSSREATRFHFEDGPLVIDAPVTRAQFEAWIAADVTAMAACVDRVLESAGASRGDVDRVFMTGGTSFVPAVRRIFDERFGADRIEAGGEMISVASGLALRARERRAGP
jgi:hypothetical chaperone protein